MKNIIYISLILLFMIITFRIINICIINQEHYRKYYYELTETYIRGSSAPRGRILDINGKVLVDNIGLNTVVYNSLNSTTDEIEIAYLLGNILKYDESKFTITKLKTFYLALHDNGEDLITLEEWKLLKERKINESDINALKYERITDLMLNTLSLEDKNAAYIYYLLTTGYYYEDKTIYENVSDEDVAKIVSLNIPGVSIIQRWTRVYPYGDTLRTLFGKVSRVPYELKEYYKEKGIPLNSIVGVSYLEQEYDDYLRGTDAIYKLEDNELTLVSEEKKGSDLYLSIDIDTELAIEAFLKEEMINAKNAKNSEYYNHSFIIVGHPKTGEIEAVLGLQIIGDNFIDITANIIHSSYTVGSIVKGATISVGYQNNLIEKGKKVLDSCIKVYGVTKKCSWTSLGWIDDIDALAQSSNYFQFLIATRLTNPNYTWNSKLNVTKEHFDIYRNMLASYGLGVKTHIDLPGEQIGIIGSRVSDDLLLNLAIGQYDTYTPIEIYQYINTIANNGIRLAPSLMKKIVTETLVIEHTPNILGKVDLKEEDMKRVQQGLNAVTTYGTGRNYTTHIVSSAGKTGTSETFIDTDGDGIMDKSTTSTAFIMYAPFDNPEYSLVIISPNIGYNSYKYSLNLRISRKIYNYLFENS